jgi:formylglycine-generating enzyme required for sulfatase activity
MRALTTASLSSLLALGCRAREPGAAIAAPAPSGSEFGPTIPNRGSPPGPPPPGMVWIPGGEFSMGGDDTIPDARPVHRVYVDGFWMDATEVTNAAFGRFARATGYRTIAERTPRPEEVPGVPPDKLRAGSVVFTPPPSPVPLDTNARWWTYVEFASWRQPLGAGGRAREHADRDRYPVVQVAYEDAEAYARWAGKRLPTEAEFEFAARGGLAGRRYAWGDDLRPGGRWMANTFQGHFPDADSGGDGWRGIAPVASFPPNGYGLYDVAGNVWEWCRDWYRPDGYAADAAAGVARNPTGPASSDDPGEPGVPKRVHRGGSFLCSDGFCTRYLVGARGRGDVATATNHLGFRCVRSPTQR